MFMLIKTNLKEMAAIDLKKAYSEIEEMINIGVLSDGIVRQALNKEAEVNNSISIDFTCHQFFKEMARRWFEYGKL